jgi:hypothetical protein
MHQLKDDMDTRQHNSPPSNVGQEEALNHHIFINFYVFKVTRILGVFVKQYTL